MGEGQNKLVYIYGDTRNSPAPRVCPGRHFAEATLFIHIAMALHVFRITPPVDEAGNEITIEPKVTGAIIL